jgi:hypothetical protein
MTRKKESILQQPWDLLNSSRKKNRKSSRDNLNKSLYFDTYKKKKKDD